MVARTRSGTSLASDSGSGDGHTGKVVENKVENGTRSLPASDPSFERKVLIAKGSLAGAEFHRLRHPKSGTGLVFRIAKENVEEVLTLDSGPRSWFYGESVVSDGSLRILAPYHPLFLVLPYVRHKAMGRYVQAEELFVDEREFPAVSKLMDMPSVKKALKKTADCREVEGEELFRWNELKAMDWLKGRFERLRTALVEHGQLHSSIRESEEVLDRYSFDVLTDYLSVEMATELKKHLDIKEPQKVLEERHEENILKRKAPEDEQLEPEKPQAAKKTPTQSTAQKRLQQASKGTKSLTAFFTKK